MSEERQPSRSSDTAPTRPSNLREESSKSTPSTTDPATDASSTGQPLRTPVTPFTPSTDSPVKAYFRVPASPRPGTMPQSAGEPSSKQAKVAIPRLKRSLESGDGAAKVGGRHRVTHACEPCRHRKTKCSGERPACRHCQDFKIACYYADGKRDRVKKQFGTMQDKVAEYERVLKDLSGRVSEADAELIRTTLEKLDTDDILTEPSVAVPSVELDDEESGAESEASGGAGSTGALDRTDEDFTRDSARSTGFMGKNSEVTWLQRLRQENKFGEGTAADSGSDAARLREMSGPSLSNYRTQQSSTNVPLPEADQGFSIQDSSYHLNDLAVSTYEAVDPYELPPPEHAQALFATYMHRSHPNFPIVGRLNLQNQFSKFLTRPTAQPPAKWLAIVNLIFAVAAKYTHLIQAEWQADERDHMIYFNRARLLAINNETLLAHPDLQTIQILGLMSHYLLAVDQVNRAWTLAGLAIRMSTALGLNVRNDSANLSDGLKEIRYRVWWALYTLEHRLCTLTGRINCIVDDHCTTPLPVPLMEEDFETELGKKLLNQEHQTSHRAPTSNSHTPSAPDSIPSSRSGSKIDASRSPSSGQQSQQKELAWAKDVQPNSALYFLHLVQLARLTQQIFQKLYNPSAVNSKWSDIQLQIGLLNQQLEDWYRQLPVTFDFQRKQRDRDFYEARIALGFFYYATKIMLHRPCLCRLDRKIPGQSAKSHDFNHAAATTCVISAQESLMLIPDEPNAVGLLRVGPWGSILHLLVQAATVLMLEISFRAHHMPEQADDILDASKKAVRWLHALGDDNLAAARAWRLCNQMLHDAAAKIGGVVDDVPQTPPRASGPPSDDASMSTNATATQNQMFVPGQNPGQQDSMTSMSMPHFSNTDDAALFDRLIQYDQMQYFPQPHGVDPSQMSYATNPNALQLQGGATDTEMNYMNQFPDHPQGPPNLGDGRSRYG